MKTSPGRLHAFPSPMALTAPAFSMTRTFVLIKQVTPRPPAYLYASFTTQCMCVTSVYAHAQSLDTDQPAACEAGYFCIDAVRSPCLASGRNYTVSTGAVACDPIPSNSYCAATSPSNGTCSAISGMFSIFCCACVLWHVVIAFFWIWIISAILSL